MIRVFAVFVLLLSCRGLYGQDPCAAQLVPDVDASSLDDVAKYSFLELINNSNYEQAQKVIERSGDADLLGLIKAGDAKLSYGDFYAKRSEFLSRKSPQSDATVGEASLRYRVSSKARTRYFNCVMSRPGLMVAFRNEDSSHTRVRVRYNGAPETIVEYVIFVADSTAGQPEVRKRTRSSSTTKSTSSTLNGQPVV